MFKSTSKIFVVSVGFKYFVNRVSVAGACECLERCGVGSSLIHTVDFSWRQWGHVNHGSTYSRVVVRSVRICMLLVYGFSWLGVSQDRHTEELRPCVLFCRLELEGIILVFDVWRATQRSWCLSIIPLKKGHSWLTSIKIRRRWETNPSVIVRELPCGTGGRFTDIQFCQISLKTKNPTSSTFFIRHTSLLPQWPDDRTCCVTKTLSWNSDSVSLGSCNRLIADNRVRHARKIFSWTLSESKWGIHVLI